MSVTARWQERHINHSTKQREPPDCVSMRVWWRGGGSGRKLLMETEGGLGFTVKRSMKMEWQREL